MEGLTNERRKSLLWSISLVFFHVSGLIPTVGTSAKFSLTHIFLVFSLPLSLISKEWLLATPLTLSSPVV